MSSIKKKTAIDASGPFKKIAIAVEAQGIPLAKLGANFKGDRIVDFDDPDVNVRVTIKGNNGAKYEVKVTINEVTKKVEGTLKKDGISHVPKDFKLSDFNLQLPR